MQRITILAVGAIKENYLKAAVTEYAKRLSRYCRLAVKELADLPLAEGASDAARDQVLAREGAQILELIRPGDYVIALEIAGRELDSVAFSDLLERTATEGHSDLVFVIGGSVGLDAAVLARANVRLSFSRMTFPHQLMRVILLEQIYRAFRIMRNEPYHK